MIVVVTPNPAIDITYSVASPRLGETNRVTKVMRRAGGKGLNVASVLTQTAQIDHAMHRRVRVSGFLGGRSGDEIQELLVGSPLEQAWLDRGPGCPTRATVAIMADDGQVTMLNEAGYPASAADWRELAVIALTGSAPGDVLVVSGSCPPGTSTEDLAGLLITARNLGMRTVLDTSGPLLLACAGLADAVKPNREELTDTTGEHDAALGAEILLTEGTQAVVVSDGPRGMDLYVAGADNQKSLAWHADVPPLDVVNPTGAGDAAVAAIAAFLDEYRDMDRIDERALVAAVALSAAAVRTPVAGLVDQSTYQSLLTTVKAEQIHASR